MKNISFFVFTVMTFFLVACGNDKKEGSSNNTFSTNPYQVSTVEGLINIQQPIIEVGSTSYQVSQQSYQVINQAVHMAQQQGIQPVLVNGVQKYRAKITGSLGSTGTYQGGYYQQGGYQSGYQQNVGNTLNVTQAVIHR